MGGTITLTTGIVMVLLFSVAIMGFAINFASDNDAAMSVSDDDEISDFYVETSPDHASSFKSESEGTYESILDTTVAEGSAVAQSSAPFAITTSNLINTMKNIITLPYKKIFGSGSGFGIFFTILASMIAFLFGLYLYKTLRGNP